jgi:deazaflavin-dependent oxidoreductase (nitroreductase family)
MVEVTTDSNYRGPSPFRVNFLDPIARFMIRRGMAPGGDGLDSTSLRVLEVRDRKTGHLYQRPVAVSAVDGQRYIVSLWGESAWARNLRADATATLQRGSQVESINGLELQDREEKAGVLLAMWRKYPSVYRRYFKVDPKQVTLEQAQDLAARYPVFRIEPAAAGAVQG